MSQGNRKQKNVYMLLKKLHFYKKLYFVLCYKNNAIITDHRWLLMAVLKKPVKKFFIFEKMVEINTKLDKKIFTWKL